MSTRMSSEAHTIYIERRTVEKERTTNMRQARQVKAFTRGA